MMINGGIWEHRQGWYILGGTHLLEIKFMCTILDKLDIVARSDSGSDRSSVFPD